MGIDGGQVRRAAGGDRHGAVGIDGGLNRPCAVFDFEPAIGINDVHAAGVLAGFKVVRVVQVAGEVDRSAAARDRDAEVAAAQGQRIFPAVGERRRGADREGAERAAGGVLHRDGLVEARRVLRQHVVAGLLHAVDREREVEGLGHDGREVVHERGIVRAAGCDVEVEGRACFDGEKRARLERHLPGELAFAIGPELAAGVDGHAVCDRAFFPEHERAVGVDNSVLRHAAAVDTEPTIRADRDIGRDAAVRNVDSTFA